MLSSAAWLIRNLLFLTILSLWLLAGPSAQAQTWKGITTDWNTGTNWFGDLVPPTGGTATFDATGTATTIDLGSGASILNLQFNSGALAYTFNNSTLTFGADGTLTINSGATTNQQFNSALAMLGAFTLTNDGTGLLTIAGGISNGTGLLTVGGSGNTTISGIIGGGSGGLTKSGNGMLTLSGANTYTGATTINGGTLRLSGGGNRLPTTTSLTLANTAGALLDLNNFNQTVASLSGGGGIGGNISLGSGTLTVNSNAITAYNGIISGTGGLTATGQATLTLGDANTYTGATRITRALINVSNLASGGNPSGIGASSSAAGNLVLDDSGILAYTGTGISTDRLLAIGANGLLFEESPGVFVNVGGVGAIVASGSGALKFTNPNPIGFDGAGLTVFIRQLQLMGNNTDDNTFGPRLIDNTEQFISLGTSLGKGMIGTWVIDREDNAYSGSTIVYEGTLVVQKLADVGQASSIGVGGANGPLVFDGGTLRYKGIGANIDRLFAVGARGGRIDASGSGPLIFRNPGAIDVTNTDPGNRTLTLGGTNTGANTLTPSIGNNPTSGNTAVAKVSTGTWVLASGNTYSGGTTITGGMLLVNNTVGSGTGTGAVTVGTGAANSGILGGTGIIAATGGNSVTANSGGTIQPGGSNRTGTLTVSNNVTFSSGSTFSIGITGGNVPPGTLGSSSIGTAPNYTSNTFLDVTTGTLTIASGTNIQIDGTGAFTQTGIYSYHVGSGPNIQPLNLVNTQSQFTTVGFTADTFLLTGDATTGRVYLNFTVTAIPEPSHILLFAGVGLGCIGWLARRVRGSGARS